MEAGLSRQSKRSLNGVPHFDMRRCLPNRNIGLQSQGKSMLHSI